MTDIRMTPGMGMGRLGPDQVERPGEKSAEEKWPAYPTMSDEELVKTNEEFFNRVVSARRHVERQALLALAFYLDQHYVDISTFQGQHTHLYHVPVPKGRVRTTNNLIEENVRMEIARMLRNRPVGSVVPENDDPTAHQAARAAESVIEHVTREYELEDDDYTAVFWSVLAGTGVIDVQWDPASMADEDLIDATPDESQDPVMGDPLSPEAMHGTMDPNVVSPEAYDEGVHAGLGGAVGGRLSARGDFAFRALSPFEFGVPDIRRYRMRDQPYVMVTKAYDPEEVYERWGKVVSSDAANVATFDRRMQGVMQGTLGSPVDGGGGGTNKADERVVVKETWIKPSFRAPRGMVLITAGDKVLERTDGWPEHYRGRYPFAKIEYIRTGSFYGKGLVAAQIPLQRRHNRANSIAVEQMNLRNSISTSIPKGTTVRTALAGKANLFEVPPGATQTPSPITPPDIGELPFQEMQFTRDAMREKSFQHEVTRGTTPPNVRSGTAISALKESDDTVVSLAIRALEKAVEHRGNLVLSIAKVKWNEPRLIRVIGREGQQEMVSFLKGRDLGGVFHVQAGSAWPFSKAERQAQVVQMLELGMIDPQEASKILEMGGLGKVFNEREADRRQAKRENQKIELLPETDGQGNLVIAESIEQAKDDLAPEVWHHHQAHLYEHDLLRKSAEFEAWPTWRQMVLHAHIAGHQAILRYLTMQQQQQAFGPEQGEQAAAQFGQQMDEMAGMVPTGEEQPAPEGGGEGGVDAATATEAGGGAFGGMPGDTSGGTQAQAEQRGRSR